MPGNTIDKLLPGVLSVTDFGAKVDGNTDDAPAVQAAIASLPAAGGIVYLPAGTLRLGSAVSFLGKSNVTLLQAPGTTTTGAGGLPAAAGTNSYMTLGVGSTQQFANIGIGVAPATNAALQTGGAINAGSQGNAYALSIGNSLVAGADGDNLFGLRLSPTISLAGHTGVSLFGLYIGASVTGAATNYAIYSLSTAPSLLSGGLLANPDAGWSIGSATGNRPGSVYLAGTGVFSFNPNAGLANDGVNYERAETWWNGTTYDIRTVAAGTGVARAVRIYTVGSAALLLGANGALRYAIDANGSFVPQSALSTTMTAGFFFIPGAAGAPTGVPASATGFPLYYDSTNQRLYVYNGSWRSVLLA